MPLTSRSRRLPDPAKRDAQRRGSVLGDLPLGDAARRWHAGPDDEAVAAGGAGSSTRRSGAGSGSIRSAGWSRRRARGDGVVATFDDGSTERPTCSSAPTASIRSSVGSSIPAAPAGRYVGLTNFGGITPADRRDRPRPRARDVAVQLRAPGVLRGPSDADRGRRLVRQCATRRDQPFTNGRRHPTKRGRHGWPGCSPRTRGPAAALIRAGRLELAGDNTYDLGHVPTWHRDRMIVIGDAAHAPAPSSGQGASHGDGGRRRARR